MMGESEVVSGMIFGAVSQAARANSRSGAKYFFMVCSL
jgi:hypothetical protein